MNNYLADTHALYWYLTNSPLLGRRASIAFDEADQGLARIYLPAIVLSELYFVNKKYGQPLDFNATFAWIQARPQFVLVSFDAADVLEFDANAAAKEMHDRMIAGVAKRLGVPCLTCDKNIVGSNLVNIVW